MSTTTAAATEPACFDELRTWLPLSVYETGLMDDAQRYESHAQDFDLTTSDGTVQSLKRPTHTEVVATVRIADISPRFQGFHGSTKACFNLKSTLTQLGINVRGEPKVTLDRASLSATVDVVLMPTAKTGVLALDIIDVGTAMGKLVALPENRRVTSLEYVRRLKEVKDMHNRPVMVVGAEADPSAASLPIDMVGGRVVVRVPILPGVVAYDGEISSVLPTVGKGLRSGAKVKGILKLHRDIDTRRTAVGTPNSFLMVRSEPLSMLTMFGRVCDDLLPAGLQCTSSNVIEPSSSIAREDRTFVFVGESSEPLTHIPVELFTVECFREHVPMSLRKRLPERAESYDHLKAAFDTCPTLSAADDSRPACVFATKGGMLERLRACDWVVADPKKCEGHASLAGQDEALQQAKQFMHQQAEYPVLTAISVGDITSDGVLLTRYFPSPILKSQILSREVVNRVKSIVFTNVSRSYGGFFSQEDRAMLIDLTSFGIRVYHLDQAAGKLLVFMRRGDSGLFVPLDRRREFGDATFFGVYGSNLVEGDFEGELRRLLEGVLEVRKTSTHPLLNKDKPLALVTGGGPGAMEVGNRVATQLGMLSCGMFVDFGSLSRKPGSNINEQKKNPYVEAYMSYRPEKLVERQSEFGLDFPIFLTGGVGTDFEYALEEVTRKVGTVAINPMILFGTEEHFANKIGHRFQENKRCGTIKGSEWLSNVPYVVSSGAEALEVYRRFFTGTLAIGSKHPANDLGFVVADAKWAAAK